MAGMELNIKVWLIDPRTEQSYYRGQPSGFDLSPKDIEWLNEKAEDWDGIENYIVSLIKYHWFVKDVVVEVEGEGN